MCPMYFCWLDEVEQKEGGEMHKSMSGALVAGDSGGDETEGGERRI